MAEVLELNRPGPDDAAYAVEKDVPLPRRGGPGRPYLYPFRVMDIGDSFLVPCDDDEKSRERTHRRLTGAWQNVPNRKFTARRVKGEGVRVWRTA